ncbi:hypothetical protein J4437_02005 [Candidatus Woesearchaeota archaeon]|nr:hypothetical protein [Candidatus Woesearchaeota archaeon]
MKKALTTQKVSGNDNFSRLLKHRNEAKKRKPHFMVKAANFSGRVKDRWRTPRGRHSPIRQKHRGKPRLVSVGYGSPKEVKGLHRSGVERVLVSNASQLLAIDKTKQGAILSASLGGKKKLELLRLAQKENISLLNVKEAAGQINSLEQNLADRKKNRKERVQQKNKKQEEKEKRAAEKKKEEEKAKKSEEEAKNSPNSADGHSNKERSPDDNTEALSAEKKKEEELKEKTLIKRQ